MVFHGIKILVNLWSNNLSASHESMKIRFNEWMDVQIYNLPKFRLQVWLLLWSPALIVDRPTQLIYCCVPWQKLKENSTEICYDPDSRLPSKQFKISANAMAAHQASWCFPGSWEKLILKCTKWIQLPFADCETKDRLKMVENKEAFWLGECMNFDTWLFCSTCKFCQAGSLLFVEEIKILGNVGMGQSCWTSSQSEKNKSNQMETDFRNVIGVEHMDIPLQILE